MKTKWLQEYFLFTKKERVAVISLIALIMLVFFLPHIIQTKHDPPSPLELEEVKKIAQQGTKQEQNDDNLQYADYRSEPDHPSSSYSSTKQLFYFDPNKISEEEWKNLGLRTKTITAIKKYLSKGGHFYKPSDLQKIYGLKPQEYNRLEAYIRIERNKSNYPTPNPSNQNPFNQNQNPSINTYPNNSNNNPSNSFYHNNPSNPRPSPKSVSITDINLADTTALIVLPGIGSKLANRIINFRDRLGGFYSVDQVAETYGLPDSTFQKIRSWLKIAAQVKKININTASADVLKVHPYIKWNIANALVQYREQHGQFKTVEELLQIAVITPAIYQKLAPYITVE